MARKECFSGHYLCITSGNKISFIKVYLWLKCNGRQMNIRGTVSVPTAVFLSPIHHWITANKIKH
jgi:hypothetical protein